MSDFIRWQKNWALQIPHLDQQHMELVEHINRIAGLVASGASHSAVPPDTGRHRSGQGNKGRCEDVPKHMRLICDHVEEFIEQARAHFREEEALMLQVDYPGYNQHKREHGILLAELVDLAREVRQGAEQVGLGTLTALKHWLIVHIVTSDQAYAEHFHRHEHTRQGTMAARQGRERPAPPGWTAAGRSYARASGE